MRDDRGAPRYGAFGVLAAGAGMLRVEEQVRHGADVWVRNAHGVAWSGKSSTR